MNDRVVRNPNFKSNGEFHRNLAARGVGAKDFPNSHTEVEHLGNGKFGASLSAGHRVFFDKADGNKPKKHKLTDERPSKDYVLVQGAKCCVEVYPYYAKYFDVQHEEVRLHEERWVVQRLFKAPDTWRDVDAYNPQIAVEGYPEPAGDVVRVTVAHDTDYGTLTVEYFQRDGNNLKHNVTFKNTSGSLETFRVLQRWAGIAGTKINGREVTNKTVLKEPIFTFATDTEPSRITESAQGLMQAGQKQILRVLTGSEESDQGVVVDKDGLRLSIENYETHLLIDGKDIMNSSPGEISTIIRAIEDCPSNARVFTAGFGLGAIILFLAISQKATEIIICEKDERVINEIGPLILAYYNKYYPNLSLQIIQGDAFVEISQHGLFDWIYMDFLHGDEISREEELKAISIPNLTEQGKFTSYFDPGLHRVQRVPYLEPVQVGLHAQGMKADFVYTHWVLAPGESLEIDPDTATIDNPTEDGGIRYESGPTYTRVTDSILLIFGVVATRGAWDYDRRIYVEWPIASLAGYALTANPLFKYEGFQNACTDEEINPISAQPSVAADADLYADIASGTAYVDPWALAVGINQSADLGIAAKTDLQNAMNISRSWFAIGMCSPDDEGGTLTFESMIKAEEYTDAPTPKPTLYVEYELVVEKKHTFRLHPRPGHRMEFHPNLKLG